MKSSINVIQAIFTAIGGYLGFILGGYDGFLYALMLFITIDYITGIMVAILEQKLSSQVGGRGIFKKILIFALVAIGHTIDNHLIKNGSVIRTAVIFFYISNEGISILENSTKIGLPIPKKLRDILIQLNEEDKKDD